MNQKRKVCNQDHCFEEAELRVRKYGEKRGEQLCWRHAPSWAKQGDPQPGVSVTIV